MISNIYNNISYSKPLETNVKVASFCNCSNNNDLILFGKKNIDAKEIKQDETQKKHKFNFAYITAMISVISQLIGGGCLVTSALLPDDAKTEDKLIPETTIVEQVTQTPEEQAAKALEKAGIVDVTDEIRTQELEQQAQNNMNTLKDILTKLGWTSLAVGNFTSGIGIAGMGLKTNQPSALLGGLGVGVCAPLMVVDPSIPLRGALCASLATFFSGFANKIKNDFELKPGEEPREYNLNFLKEAKNWKGALTNKTEAKKFASNSFDMLKFIAKDQVLLLTSAGKAVDQSVKKLFGIRKELPEFMTIKPSSEQRRITSMLVYSGGLPLLFFGGNVESITMVAEKLIGAGFGLGNIGMFALGYNQKDSTRPALLIGCPLKLIGDFMVTKDYGFGLSQMGSASHNYYIASQNKTKKVKDPDSNDDKAITKEKKTADKTENTFETKRLKESYKAQQQRHTQQAKNALKYHKKNNL